MSDEFPFRAAPARKTAQQIVADAVPNIGTQERELREAEAAANNAPVKRKRRTRVEMAVQGATSSDIAVLKVCLKQLRTLSPADAARVVVLLGAVFG